MPASETYARAWLIEQYLAGALSDTQQQRIDDLRQADPLFDQQVVAHWLVQRHLLHQQAIAESEEASRQWLDALDKPPGRRKTGKIIHLLPHLLMAAASVMLVLLLSQPPDPQPGRVGVADAEGYGYEGLPVPVIRYEHLPGLLGQLYTADRYRWPADTLFIYGKASWQTPLQDYELTRLTDLGQYQLRIGQRTYSVQRGQQSLTLLVAK